MAAARQETPTLRDGVVLLLAALKTLIGLLMLGMVGVNLANAAGRYGAGLSLTGTDELLVIAMIWLVMTGLVVVTAERTHIALDLLPDRLSARPRAALACLHHVVVTLACGYAAIQSQAVLARVARLGQVTMGLGVPSGVLHAALMLGFALTTLVALLIAIEQARRALGSNGQRA